MNHATFSQLQAVENPRAGITRLIRRICVLREHGEEAQAGQLHNTALADAVRDYRLAHGPDALPERELQEIFVAEERRVSEAAILSELLVPRLVASVPALRDPVRSTVVRSGPERGLIVASSPAAAVGPPSISDLLDAMLAAERNTGLSAATSPRESRTRTIRT